MQEIPKVALLVETSRGFGRELLCGISRYSQLHGPWNFFLRAGDYEQMLPQMHQWGGTGIIARIANDRVAHAILDVNLPTIALGLSDEQMRPGSPLAKFSELSSNAVEVATIAANHLLERRFSHFAYVGLEDRCWSQRRVREFTRQLNKLDASPHVYSQPKRRQDRIWENEQVILADWLQKLPKPVGLFACNDDRGREVLEACMLADLRVPEDVAVLGVDNDEVFCDLAYPPLSSVALNAGTAGYRAAELLDAMMHGRIRKPRHIAVEALGVVTRRSTDIVAVEDHDVATALRYIHNKKGFKITVESVVEEVVVSRRHLEKRFRELMGRTILEEIQIARLQQAKRLLLETTFPVSKVAELAGFGTTGYFIQFFQQRAGKTPGKYRTELST